LPREILRRHLAIAVHKDAQRFLRIVLEDQRLHHREFVDAELLGGHARAAARFVRVEVRAELNLVLPQHTDCHGYRIVGRHPAIIGITAIAAIRAHPYNRCLQVLPSEYEHHAPQMAQLHPWVK
jgi:hypothetical protein